MWNHIATGYDSLECRYLPQPHKMLSVKQKLRSGTQTPVSGPRRIRGEHDCIILMSIFTLSETVFKSAAQAVVWLMQVVTWKVSGLMY